LLEYRINLWRLFILKLLIVVFFFSSLTFAQSKTDPEKIKSQKIRTATKIATDLKGTENFTPRPVSTIIYDEEGKQAEFIKYDISGNFEIHYYYKYDDRGNTTEVIGLKADGSLGNRWIYEHDENNIIVRQTSYRPDGLVGRDYVFSYYERGIRQTELIYDSKQLIEQTEYLYEFYNEED